MPRYGRPASLQARPVWLEKPILCFVDFECNPGEAPRELGYVVCRADSFVLEHGSRLIKTNVPGGWPQRYLHGLRDGGGDDIADVFSDFAILLKRCCRYARRTKTR